MKYGIAFLAILLVAGVVPALAAETSVPGDDEDISLAIADTRLSVAERMIQGGIYDRALDLASSILDAPAARAVEGEPEEIQAWLRRREMARFLYNRARFGLAGSQDELFDVAESLVQLFNNRYRLSEPQYDIQSAYWAARAFEAAGGYRNAVEYYGKVGGAALPPEMEGDAAQRMSRCLRLLAEDIPFPGSLGDRESREQLLNQAINELDRARLAFPIGQKRKEIELDRIALRMAQRDEQYIREAVTEAKAYIDSDPTRDELRARATLYRGNASSLLGDSADAVVWYRRVIEEESPTDEDRRLANLGLALCLYEISEGSSREEKHRLLSDAAKALDQTLDGTMSPGPWDGARIVKARILLFLDQPTAAVELLSPILETGRVNYRAWHAAGMAELARGSPGKALTYLYPSTRPSNSLPPLRLAASRDAAGAADLCGDLGLAVALNHHALRMMRRDRLFSSLLVAEFKLMETLLKLGKADGPVSLSGDRDMLAGGLEAAPVPLEEKRSEALRLLSHSFGVFLATGGDPDTAYDLAVRAEAANEWQGDGMDKLELSIGLISHLRKRQPAGVTDNILSSRLGEARHAMALARAERILAGDAPADELIDRTLGDFASSSADFQEASSDGFSVQDSLDQGMVNMDSGAFLMRLSDKWNSGAWSGRASAWREEARQRIEASLRPFNQAIATSRPSSLAAQRARWSRGRALELVGELRGAAGDYLFLMNNSEFPRMLRVNAARRWALCMLELGEARQALARLSAFADIDAETALLAGRLAEDSGDVREAYQRYLFAANPASPSLPPATPGRVQEAVLRAARLAIRKSAEAGSLLPAADIDAAKEMLESNAFADLGGPWTIPMLNLLGETWLEQSADGWRIANDIAHRAINQPGSDGKVDRAMHVLSARALARGGDYNGALDELDAARELLDGIVETRSDAALITLETARVFRMQGRTDDALRAYADVFAVYTEAEDYADAARLEAAEMLLAAPNPGSAAVEQARNILRGLRDQVRAERIMRGHGIH